VAQGVAQAGPLAAKAIANVVNIWLMESPAFSIQYDDSGYV
jgi:hypothetical protein